MTTMNSRFSVLFLSLSLLSAFPTTGAFVCRPANSSPVSRRLDEQGPPHIHARRQEVSQLFAQRTFSTSPPSSARRAQSPQQTRRRLELLSRNGPHFQLNRFSGQIEFGATARLSTQLDTEPRPNEIATWLKDERGLAMSIWDEKLTTDLGNYVYRLQIMTLQFVTLTLSPSVDVRMRTVSDAQSKRPVFTLDSVAFDPNIELLPGMKISAESLGIVIEVAGELRANADGRGVQGRIAFQTSGSLPPPMRVLPDAALKVASDTINETVANFAIESFQRGARAQYRAFLKKEKQRKQQEQEQKQEQ